MDLKTLGNILAAIGGFATTAVPIVFSLCSSTVSIADDTCGLSGTEVTMLQSSMLMRNETCAYNMTLNEILGMTL